MKIPGLGGKGSETASRHGAVDLLAKSNLKIKNMFKSLDYSRVKKALPPNSKI